MITLQAGAASCLSCRYYLRFSSNKSYPKVNPSIWGNWEYSFYLKTKKLLQVSANVSYFFLDHLVPASGNILISPLSLRKLNDFLKPWKCDFMILMGLRVRYRYYSHTPKWIHVPLKSQTHGKIFFILPSRVKSALWYNYLLKRYYLNTVNTRNLNKDIFNGLHV